MAADELAESFAFVTAFAVCQTGMTENFPHLRVFLIISETLVHSCGTLCTGASEVLFCVSDVSESWISFIDEDFLAS